MSFKSHTSAMSYRNEAEEAEITPQNIIRNISFALENAQKGVHLDEEGNHEQAWRKYQETVELLQAQINFVPETLKANLESKIQIYNDRINVLSQYSTAHKRSSSKPMRPYKMALGGRDRMNSLSRLPFVEVDMSTQNPCLYPPRSLLRRPYWELRVLCRTIMEGGFISPRIFIPKGMWVQDGAKIPGVHAKIASMEALIQHVGAFQLNPLPAGDIDFRKGVWNRLNTLCEQLNSVQNILARSFDFIEEVPEEEPQIPPGANTGFAKFSHRVAKAAKSATSTLMQLGNKVPSRISSSDNFKYVSLLADIFAKCEIFDRWAIHFGADYFEDVLNPDDDEEFSEKWAHFQEQARQDPGSFYLGSEREARETLRFIFRIGMFFHSTFCSAVRRDLMYLIERYMRKSRKAFSRCDLDDI